MMLLNTENLDYESLNDNLRRLCHERRQNYRQGQCRLPGGIIVVLGLGAKEQKLVGFFPCTGMHGGKLFLRSACTDIKFPDQVTALKFHPLRNILPCLPAYFLVMVRLRLSAGCQTACP